jgi:hypothetical protein
MQRIRKYIAQRQAARLSRLIFRQNELFAALGSSDYYLYPDTYHEIEDDIDRHEDKIQALSQSLYGPNYDY